MPERILILSGQHFVQAPRHVSLHFMAHSFLRQGHHVDFMTLRLSQVSRKTDPGRWAYAHTRPINQWTRLSPQLREFIWVNTLHPINLRNAALNHLTTPLFKLYGHMLPRAVLESLGQYTVVMLESGLAPLLFDTLQRHAPRASFIYHGADRLRTIGVHPVVEAELARTAHRYHLIRVMAQSMAADFPADAPVIHMPHGISKDAFEQAERSPYDRPHNVVSVGDMLFDAHAVRSLAQQFPGHTFHLFGQRAVVPDAPDNIVHHGETPFAQVVPYIRHADVGLAPYLDGHSADYLCQSSLKMIQYTWARLPIVAPGFAAAGRPHVCTYDIGQPASLQAAFNQALNLDRQSIDTGDVLSWDEVADRLLRLVHPNRQRRLPSNGRAPQAYQQLPQG